MAYILKEKQREYQREWVQKKKNRNKDGSICFSSGQISWEELSKLENFEKINSWQECIDTAKKMAINKKVNRLLMAELAIKSCLIKHGGNYKQKSFLDGVYRKTLREFANEVQIHYKTLHEWIRVKKLVFDKIEDKTTSFDYSAAFLAMRAGNLDEVLDQYAEIKNDHSIRHIINSLRYLSNADKHFTKYKKKLTLSQKRIIKCHANSILSAVGE